MSSPEPDAAQLERYREYLTLLARLGVPPRLRGKISASDVVQQTMLEASQAWDDFVDHGTGARTAWLRQILVHNLANLARDFGREKRNVERERSIEALLNQSSARIGMALAAGGPSPSDCASREENAVRLAQALAQLPETQREAVALRHLECRSLADIAQQLETTTAAVSGLLHRGLARLREILEHSE